MKYQVYRCMDELYIVYPTVVKMCIEYSVSCDKPYDDVDVLKSDLLRRSTIWHEEEKFDTLLLDTDSLQEVHELIHTIHFVENL